MVSKFQAQRPYEPPIVFPPGAMLKEALEERGMTQAELAVRMNRPKKTISEIASGSARLTAATALELESVLGIPAVLWNNLQSGYDSFMAKQARAEALREGADELLADIPIGEMVSRGWLNRANDKVGKVQEVFRFFAVSSVSAWHAQYGQLAATFRASEKKTQSSHGSRAAWYRKAEVQLESLVQDCPEYDSEAFERALSTVRKLTSNPIAHAFDETVRLCREAGVVVTLVKELPKAGLSGATIWRNKTPGVVLTLRYKSDDQFWFSFFHEAGHVLLHRGKTILESGEKNTIEDEANKFAADLLIPPKDMARIRRSKTISASTVRAFAEELGISPGIVVGRLQFEKKIAHGYLHELKVRLRWAEPVVVPPS